MQLPHPAFTSFKIKSKISIIGPWLSLKIIYCILQPQLLALPQACQVFHKLETFNLIFPLLKYISSSILTAYFLLAQIAFLSHLFR